MGFFDFFGLSAEDQLILRGAIKFLRENGLNDYCDKVERDTRASKLLVKLQKNVNESNEALFRATMNLPTAAKHCGMTQKEMKLTFWEFLKYHPRDYEYSQTT